MRTTTKIINVSPQEAERIWSVVDDARFRFPERFVGMNDVEVLNELIRIALFGNEETV